MQSLRSNGQGRHRNLAPTLAAVLAIAVLSRWLGYTGFFGSDEVTYTGSAFKLLQGDWTVERYVGANRLGVNLPMAGFAWLLGQTEFAAALYSLLCSLGEVALVVWVAYRIFGIRAAFFGGLLMATLPVHIHFAGRLMADAPLCLAISAAFVLFYEAEVRRWPFGYFLAGVCAGLSFWIKPVTLFVFGVFLVYPLVVRRFDVRWLWMAVGLAAAMAANGLLFMALTGNFWFIFDVMREGRASGSLEAGVAAGAVASDAHVYLTYLFGKIYHTALVGFLALGGVAAAWSSRRTLAPATRFGLLYLLFWALGLLLILSVLPVGFNPLQLVPKQTNYMLIFAAPLCLLGGYTLSRIPLSWSVPATVGAVASGLLFAMLLQGSIAVFTANSWATLKYVQDRPDATFYVMSNALRAASFQALTQGADVESSLRPIQELFAPAVSGQPAPAGVRFAVIDEQTLSWDPSRPYARPDDRPACWIEVDSMQGSPQGLGVAVLHGLAAAPGVATSSVGARLRQIADPLPARVYRLPAEGC